jgi:hypothetical protein
MLAALFYERRMSLAAFRPYSADLQEGTVLCEGSIGGLGASGGRQGGISSGLGWNCRLDTL